MYSFIHGCVFFSNLAIVMHLTRNDNSTLLNTHKEACKHMQSSQIRGKDTITFKHTMSVTFVSL